MIDDENETKPDKSYEFDYFVVKRIMNPFSVSRVLIHLGHEPLLPTQMQFPFSQPFLCYPNFIYYTAYMVYNYGFWRLITTGFIAKTLFDCGSLSSRKLLRRFVKTPLLRKHGFKDEDEIDTDSLLREASISEVFSSILKISIIKTAIIVLTQPVWGKSILLIFNFLKLKVVFIRQVASLVDSNRSYESFFGAIYQIFSQSGFAGFYSVGRNSAVFS
ncbi:mitochondrial carrier [Cichlidogyrus casuarinus]|uniref:Mitochondrial carrier n=1 Tax=Cichlidogyrus casuarinus TaxID=1844966 RepID=A0ABD2Q4X5_9PLAT